MGHLFKARELVELGILIEKNGEDFYTGLQASTQDGNAKDAFSYLAGEEKKHIAVFEGLMKTLGEYEVKESYPGEYDGYMKAMADSHVFTRKDTGKSLAQKIKTSGEAIETALRFEQESIDFFEGMRQFIPAAQHKTVNELVDEEKSHISKLEELRKTMGKQASEG
jgi:rubrerythrin